MNVMWEIQSLTNKEASAVICSVVEHAGSGRARKKYKKARDAVECFPYFFIIKQIKKPRRCSIIVLGHLRSGKALKQ